MFLNREYLKNQNLNFKLLKNKKYLNSVFTFLGKKIILNSKNKFIKLLKHMYGIGYKHYIKFFIHKLGFSVNFLLVSLNVVIFQKLQLWLKNLFLNYELKKYIRYNISLKKRLRLYQGVRLLFKLPARGQRSKTNAGTVKQSRKNEKKNSKRKRKNRKK